MLKSVLAISIGASLGALLRWGLANRLNGMFPFLPPGTLVANLVGGYVVGIAMAYFAARHVLPLEWRLFVVTGFCGGLTTFSTFSAEVVGLLQQGRAGWAAATVGTHLAGSLAMTMAGIWTVGWMRS